MNHNGHPFSRRRLLAGAAAASAVTVTGVATAPTAAAAATAHRSTTPLVTRDRIGSAALHAPDGTASPGRFQADFHDRLTAWLAFWSANSPRAWNAPAQVLGTVDAAGDAFVLHAVRYRRDDDLHDGFAASRADGTRWATVASLHHHFPTVAVLPGGAVRVTDGPAGFTGSAAQVDFAVAACRELWGETGASASRWQEYAARPLARAGQRGDVASRAGWATFTRLSLRRGLGTESYA